MVQILPKLIGVPIFCNLCFSKLKSTKLTSIQIDEKQNNKKKMTPPPGREKWSSSRTMRQVRTSARTGVHALGPETQRRQKKSAGVSLWTAAALRSGCAGFSRGSLRYIYLRFDLAEAVRLLLGSAAYRLIGRRAWSSVATLSPSPSDVPKLWSPKKSRLRERTATQKRAEFGSEGLPFLPSCSLCIIRSSGFLFLSNATVTGLSFDVYFYSECLTKSA